MRFGVLGPIEVWVDGQSVPLGGPKQRALLAFLLLHANEAVSRDRLIDVLWGESPPPSASESLDAYVYRLRKLIGREQLARRGGGYLLSVEGGELDADRFDLLVARGRQAADIGDAPGATRILTEALALWRGPALADVLYQPFASAQARQLGERRLEALESRVEAELEMGRAAALVPELEQLVADHPLRERLVAALMLALYRAGRQADALAVYQRARRTLVEELGLEPGPALQRLECAILQQDASLDLPGPAAPAPGPAAETRRPSLAGPGRKKRLLAVAGALAVAISLLVAVAARGQAHVVAGANTVGMIDTGQADLSAVVTGVGRPAGIASGARAVWVTDSADDQLLRVESAGQVIDRIPVGRGPSGVTAGDGEIWVANQLDGTVSEVNPGAGTQVATIPAGIGPSAIAFGYNSVWVGNVTSDTLTRIDAATGDVVATISLGSSPAGIAVGAGAVWVASQETGELLRVDPARNRLSRAIPAGQSPDGLAVGAGNVWVADANGTLARFDPRTGRVRTIKVGGVPAGVAFADGAVWVGNSLSGAVSRIDPGTGAVQLIRVGNEPAELAAAGNRVWVTVLPSLASHRGGTLTVIAQPQLPSLGPIATDPAVAYSPLPWQVLSMTNDGLVGYRRVAGLAGDQLVPDLAAALPVPADGGTTYTFRLRRGIRYSTGQLVHPEDFRRAIERVFMINNQAGASIPPLLAGIVGASRCERNRGPCNLARGIVADDAANTVTFHLTAPDPVFLYKLAFSWAYAVPPGTPDREISAAQLPATGPYMTKSFVQWHTWILVRNPRFRQWSQQAQPGGYPDRIVVRLDVGPSQGVAEVEHGRADVLLDPPPGSVGQLATHYTSQLHSGPQVTLYGIALNTRVPPSAASTRAGP